MKKLFLIFLIVFFNIFCGFSKNETEITIFFTNDTNGHPLSFNFMGEVKQGGMPARFSLIKKLSRDRKKSNIIILNSGGIVRGRPESNLYNGIPDIYGMNKIGYYASGAGTSEFYESAERLKDLNKKAKFKFLSSNVVAVNEKDRYVCDRYIVKQIGGSKGVKIGLFSLLTEEAINEISDQAKKDFVIANPIDTAKQIIAELKNKRNEADIVIALTHLGYYPDDANIGSRALASAVDGIDIIIDGRTGLKLDKPVIINNTKICQAFKWGLYLGEIKLTVVDKKISDFRYKLYPVNITDNGKYIEEQIKENSFVSSTIKGKMKNFESRQKSKIAVIDGNAELTTKEVRYKETEIGNLICDALLDYTKADVAIQNAGGIGENKSLSGTINRKSFDEIIKYDNSVVVCTVKGENILRILNYSMTGISTGRFLQVGGIKFNYSKSSKGFSEIYINGEPIDNLKFYKIAINSWLSDGADGYKIFTQIPDKIDYNIIHREVVYNYIEKQKNIKPAIDGRINIID